jgi:hypothetical protein
MSDVEKVTVSDSRINTGAEVFKIPVSGRQVQYLQVPFDNQPQNGYGSTIQISSLNIPNSDNTCVSRIMKVAYRVTVQVPTAIVAALNPPTKLIDVVANEPGIVLRQYPLNSVCEVINLGLNSNITTTQPRYFLSMLSRYMDANLVKKLQCPAMPDYNTNSTSASAVPLASVSSPFSFYGNCVKDGLLSRASHLCSVGADVGGTTTITWNVSEPLLASPLSINDEQEFFYNLNTLSVNLNIANYNDMILINKDITALQLSAIKVTVFDAQLELAYITVDQNVVKIPAQVNYDYCSYQPNPYARTQASTTTTELTIQSQSLQFNALPSRIFCCVRKQLQYRDPALSVAGTLQANDDVALSILPISGDWKQQGRLQVNIGTKGTAFTNMDSMQIYEMCKRNGYNSSFYDFALGSGSWIAFSPTKDIGLDPTTDTVVGEDGKVNFQMQIVVSPANIVASSSAAAEWLASFSANYELYIMPEYAGVCSIQHRGMTQYLLGDVTPADVTSALKVAPIPENSLPQHLQGSGLFNGKLGNLVKKGLGKVAEHLASEEGQKLIGKAVSMGASRLAKRL